VSFLYSVSSLSLEPVSSSYLSTERTSRGKQDWVTTKATDKIGGVLDGNKRLGSWSVAHGRFCKGKEKQILTCEYSFDFVTGEQEWKETVHQEKSRLLGDDLGKWTAEVFASFFTRTCTLNPFIP